MGNRITVSNVDSVDFVDFVDFDPDPDPDNDRSPLIGKGCLAKEAYKTAPAPHGRGGYLGEPLNTGHPARTACPKGTNRTINSFMRQRLRNCLNSNSTGKIS